jgi:peptidoglycan/xylan/chitin deacetylase (PgdA/CDA1 family)
MPAEALDQIKVDLTMVGGLMDLLARCQVATTGVFSGLAIDGHPGIAREWVGRGHEIAAHSYAQEILTYTLTPDEERANIRRCVDAIRKATGQPPLGWCSPALQPSAHSVDLLLEEGFLYSMDFADDDIPYVVERQGGRLVAIPYQYDLNDMGLYLHPPAPQRVLRVLQAEVRLPLRRGDGGRPEDAERHRARAALRTRLRGERAGGVHPLRPAVLGCVVCPPRRHRAVGR